METELAQVYVLLDAKRYRDAEVKLRGSLAREPRHVQARALLAYILYLQDRDAEAVREAEQTISLSPDNPTPHYYRALALLALDRDRDASAAIQEAIRLDPERASYHAVVSRIHARKKDWRRSLKAAEEGLRLDPENVPCRNLQARAQVHLGKEHEAEQAFEQALAQDPENPMTHANQGWALLRRGEHKQALVHFGESLRLDPTSDWARQGIVEALKARNPIYRFMLRYFLMMSSLTTAEQWGVLTLVSGGRRALTAAARAFPPLFIVVGPLLLLYFFFGVLTWTARPLFALVLRFDRFGRLALPREEIVASNWVGACLAIAGLSPLVGGALALAFRDAACLTAFLLLAAMALAMTVPVSAVFRARAGLLRGVLGTGALLLGLLGLITFVSALIGGWAFALSGASLILFVAGWVLFPLITNLLIILWRK